MDLLQNPGDNKPAKKSLLPFFRSDAFNYHRGNNKNTTDIGIPGGYFPEKEKRYNNTINWQGTCNDPGGAGLEVFQASDKHGMTYGSGENCQ